MLQVARLARTLLHEAAAPVADYLRGQFNPDGGVRDRSGASDLYYTVFGLEGLAALQAEMPVDGVRRYLAGFGDGGDLDLVHLACLARCWASLPAGSLDPGERRRMIEGLGRFRAADGGFAPRPGAAHGTAYHSFLACGAYQDLGEPLPDPAAVDRLLDGLATADGGYANEARAGIATTPNSAAAVALKRQLGGTAGEAAGRWILARAVPEGGFLAAEGAPMPDLLSTATALHALAGLEVSFEALREPCLDFVDTLWTGSGFCGTWADEAPDAEYTYYGLLALGHLSL
jgi:hypothetical protein